MAPPIYNRLLQIFKQPPPAEDKPLSDSGRAHVSGFLQPEEMNPLLQGVEGLRIYDQMYRTDPDIRRAVRMTVNPVISATWSVEAYGGDEAEQRDKEVAENLEWALGLGAQGATSPLRPRWQTHLTEALPGVIRWGYCPFEVTWTTAERNGKHLITPSRIGMRLPRTIYRWLLDENHELQALEQFLPLRGYVTIPRADLLYYRTDAEGDNYEGISLLRPCFKPWYFKDKIERLDVIAQEREAIGLPVVYPPRAGVTSPAVLEDLEGKLQNLRAGELAYLIMPGPKADHVKDQGGWEFSIEGLAGSKGGREPYKALEHYRDSIAASFIQEFMRLGQSGVGARATASVQEGPFNMACEALAAIVATEANEVLIPRWVALNYGEDCPLPTVQMSMAEEDLDDLRDYVSVLSASGLLQGDGPLEDFLRERASLPPADPIVREEELKLKQAQRQAATDVATNPASHEPQAGGNNPEEDQERAVDRREAHLGPDAEASRDREWSAMLLDAVRRGDTREQRRLLDTPNRSDHSYSGDGTWPVTSGTAGVDGVPTPDLMNDFVPMDSWVCPCGNANCGCKSPVDCSFIPTVDWSYSIDQNPRRPKRNAGDGTDASRPDALVGRGSSGQTLSRPRG